MGKKRTLNRFDYQEPNEEYLDDDDESVDDDEDEDDELSDDEDDEEKPKKRKKAPAKKKTTTRRRTRATKAPRMRVVWGVFDNSNKRVATFGYAEKKEAEAQAEKLQEDKGQVFFVQPVKEEITEEPTEPASKDA